MNKEIEKVFTERGFTNIEQMATMFDYYKQEIERLNNIINELEKWLEEEQINSIDLDEWTIIQVRDKILELKRVDKE